MQFMQFIYKILACLLNDGTTIANNQESYPFENCTKLGCTQGTITETLPSLTPSYSE